MSFNTATLSHALPSYFLIFDPRIGSSYQVQNTQQHRRMAITDKTIAFISGANQGIGAATAIRLAKEHNFHVIIGSRNIENGQNVATQLISEGFSADSVQLDLESDDSIDTATTYLTETYGHLDVLINNAAIFLEPKGLPIRQLFNDTFATNVTGTACLTKSLLSLLRQSAQRPRVIFVSSGMGSLTLSLDTTLPWYPADYQAYDASKAAMNILAVNYSRILADKEAHVNAVSPGLVATNMTGNTAYGDSPENGAQRIVELATLTGVNSDVTGTFSDKNGPVPW